MKKFRVASFLLVLVLLISVCLAGCGDTPADESASEASSSSAPFVDVNQIPQFSDQPYVKINYNLPVFSADEITTKSFERYSELDSLGRCGVAEACIGIDIMPTEERGEIGQVKPTGWHTVKYDIVDGKYLYNRCHLIGFQLTGENANTKNLITGTRYFNVEGMLPFENMVADYVKETENHVMYRVTPYYEGNELVARGVYMEAYSVEDEGEGILFNVFVYNNQPGITIDYSTGESRLADETESQTSSSDTATDPNVNQYILNTNSKKFHLPDCSGAKDMKESNKQEYTGNRADLIADGYSPCKICNP